MLTPSALRCSAQHYLHDNLLFSLPGYVDDLRERLEEVNDLLQFTVFRNTGGAKKHFGGQMHFSKIL